jgi:hypothetical protein
MKTQPPLKAAICLLLCLFLFGCSYLSGRRAQKVEAPNEFAAMIAKKDELAALPTTEKLSKMPSVKGKLVIVQNHNGTISLDRFSEKGETFFSEPPVQGEIYTSFLPAELYAKHPDEIETLVKVNCVTKKDSALYKNRETSKIETMYYDYTVCDIAFVDYKTATVIAKKQVGKNEPPNVLNKNSYGRTPGREIADYLGSITATNKAPGTSL